MSMTAHQRAKYLRLKEFVDKKWRAYFTHYFPNQKGQTMSESKHTPKEQAKILFNSLETASNVLADRDRLLAENAELREICMEVMIWWKQSSGPDARSTYNEGFPYGRLSKITTPPPTTTESEDTTK